MARTNNLTNFLTDVATSIKAKTGDSTAIPASQFDTKIATIETGKLTQEEYNTADEDLDTILEGTTLTPVYPPDWSELGYANTPQSIMNGFNYAKNIKDNWDSSITACNSKYANNLDIIYMPVVDTSNVTNMNNMFSYASNLAKVETLNTSNVTDMRNLFYYCSKLIEIPILDASKITVNFKNAFGTFSNLTNDSLNNILATCLSATNYIGTKTLKQIGLTSAQATTCTGLSNWSDCEDAGWTTGY